MKTLVPGIHVLLVLPLAAATLNVRIFQKATQCPGMVLKTQLRVNATYEFSGKLQCAANCPPDAGCRSFIYDPTTKRCTMGTQASSANCSNMESAAGYEHYDLVRWLALVAERFVCNISPHTHSPHLNIFFNYIC